MKEVIFDSPEEYLEVVQHLRHQWRLVPGALWFRGVSDKSYSLVPGCVWRGIDLDMENSMVGEFLIHYRSHYKPVPDDPLELYALMQHYGLPTRLLDWTASPLVALYFAMEKVTAAAPAVWVMSPVDLNKIVLGEETNIVPKPNADCYTRPWLPRMLRDDSTKVPPEPFAFKHPLVNPRIAAQKGCFTFHGVESKGIEEYFERARNPCIAKLTLKDVEKRALIMEYLYTMGFREDDIYQDLNSLTRRILREHSVAIRSPK